jgi:hypothetical protein
LCSADTWDTSDSSSEMPEKFCKVVLEKDGVDQLDRSCEKWRSVTGSQRERNILQAAERTKGDRIGHILCMNCLIKHVI